MKGNNTILPTALAVVTAIGGCTVPLRSTPEQPADANRRGSVPSRSDSRGFPAAASADDPVAAAPAKRLRVGSEIVEPDEFRRDTKAELGKAATSAPDAFRKYVEQLAGRWITDKVAEMLLHQQASLRLSPEADSHIDKHVDGEIRKIVTTEYQGIQARYEKALAVEGLTVKDIHKKLRREVIIGSFLDTEVRPKVGEPTRADLLAAFEANADLWRRPARRRMSLVDVRVGEHLPSEADNPTAEQLATARAAARSKIEEARSAMNGGEEFGEVARRFSNGLHASEGGDWGWITPGTVRERFEPAVDSLFGLKVGQVSDVIEVQDGFFLVRCEEHDAGMTEDFQTVQPKLKDHYFRSAYQRRINELVGKLRAKARIDPLDLERFHSAVVETALNPSASAAR